uniref:DUF1996 domain-containing protein n=1 Tax=Psilocybe cubensis TaxID=181762 RepID=A0A8H7XJJ2_PSICU
MSFRMISGDPTLRTYDPTSFAQQAVTFLCLDFNGVSTKHNELPSGPCPSGIRAQINFPSCWDGKNLDSPDHKSHVAFLSNGPDSGTCSDPKFPVVLPRIFMEVYWGSQDFDSVRSQARNTSQPFVYAHGDPTGYGYHADFINGWDKGVLQKAVDNCHCNEFGDATCCAQQGIFDLNQGKNCRITKAIDEQTTGTLLKLPGNNPVQPYGKKATIFTDNVTPPLLSPIFAYTGDSPTATGTVVTPGQTQAQQVSSVAATSAAATSAAISSAAVSSAAAATSVNAPVPPASSSSAVAANPGGVSSAVSSAHVPTTTPVASSQVPATSPRSATSSVAVSHQTTATVKATSIVPPATRPSALPSQGNGLYGGPGSASGSGSNSGSTSGSHPGSGSSNAPGNSSNNHSGSGMSSGSHSGPGSSGHGTCSSKKKRRAMEQHRRRTFDSQAPHVRHLDYVYTN